MRRLLPLLLLLTLVSLGQAQPLQGVPILSHPLLRGLQHWYLGVPGLTGGSLWYDLAQSAVREHGVLTNMGYSTTSGWSPSTRPGGYMQLNLDNTDDYVALAGNSGLTATTPLTICSWVKLTAITVNTTVGILTNCNPTAFQYPGLYWRASFGGASQLFRPEVALCSEAGNCGTQINVRADASLSFNTWYHLCVAVDGSATAAGIALYLNGQPLASTVAIDGGTGAFTYTDRPWRIGRELNDGQPFNGSLDDLMIFTRALAAREITQLYQSSAQGHPALLVPPSGAAMALAPAGPPGHFFPFFR